MKSKSPIFKCDKCGKTFTKAKITRHISLCKDPKGEIDVNKLRLEIKNKMTKQYITNRETLKEKIHQIHNIIRNNGLGYSMQALKIFSVFYGLKKLEEYELLTKFGLGNNCKFSELLKLDKETLNDRIIKDTLDELAGNELRPYIFYEIPRRIHSDVMLTLFNEMQELSLIEKATNTQLAGKLYEYFIGRDDTAISELGAYFTDRHIVNYVYNNLINPIADEKGEIKTMIDPFGGSGGFTGGYVMHLMHNSPKIDWSKEKNKIYHYDVNEDVIKYAGLEFVCLTKEIPSRENFKCVNSFKHSHEKKFQYVITNPPYGGDKSYKSDGLIKRDKLKKELNRLINEETDKNKIQSYKIQISLLDEDDRLEENMAESSKVNLLNSCHELGQYAKANKLDGNDKESVSLILVTYLLDVNGTAIVVLKEGVLFNSKYKSLRKYLIEKFNVRKIIGVPNDQFENTTTKTSIILFDNTEKKTENVEFYDLTIDISSEDTFEIIDDIVQLKENKGDIKNINNKLLYTAKLEDITKTNYSLDIKDYLKREIIPNDGYKLVKLGDICEFLKKSKRQASFGKDEGKYPFYASSSRIKYCDICDYNDEAVIIGNGGNANLHLDKNFSCSDHNYILKTKNNKFIYYTLLSHFYMLEDGFHGSVIKNISITYIKQLSIPIPIDEAKIKEWTDKISAQYDAKNEKEARVKQLEEGVKNKIKEITENEDCEQKKLGDIFERGKNGKTNTKDISNTGEYPFYSATANNPSGTHSQFDFDDKIYFIFAKSGGNSSKKFGEELGIGKFWLVKNKSSANIAMIKFKLKNKLNYNYVDYYLKNILFDIQKYASYTTGNGNINVNKMLDTFYIKVPKYGQLIDNMIPNFQLIDQLKSEIVEHNKLFNQLIKQLGEESI